MATRPPELQMDAKWEAAIDLTLRRLVYGSLAGGAAGLMLFGVAVADTLIAVCAGALPRANPPRTLPDASHNSLPFTAFHSEQQPVRATQPL